MRPSLTCVFLLVIFFSLPSGGEVRVAFFERHDSHGHLVQLEKDGRFNHVAVFYDGGWLHSSYTSAHVEWTRNLSDIGLPVEILTKTDADLDEGEVQSLADRPYDAEFLWEGPGMYCSKLVGILLKIPPRPMAFDTSWWPPSFQKMRGRVGLSPDDIFEELTRRGYTASPEICRDLLNSSTFLPRLPRTAGER